MQKPINFQHQVGVIADIDGLELTPEDREFLLQPEIAGLILFSRNYQSPCQLAALTASLKKLRPDLLICVDQEGGRVQRFREGFTRLPAMMTLEAHDRNDPQQAQVLAEDLGWLMALELIEQGVDLSFAPVLDIERDCSLVIGDRAFGHDAETVARLASAFVRGMASLQMKAVGKHFPGHGGVVADSHLALPVDERDKAELDYDIQPFAELMSNQLLAGVMPAHVVYPAVDAELTAGFSPRWLQQILRQQLNFNGVIFSDDLSMAGAAAAGSYRERSDKAIQAGCNALLACNDRVAATEVVAAVRTALADNTAMQRLDLSSLIPAKYQKTDADELRRRNIQQQINQQIV